MPLFCCGNCTHWREHEGYGVCLVLNAHFPALTDRDEFCGFDLYRPKGQPMSITIKGKN